METTPQTPQERSSVGVLDHDVQPAPGNLAGQEAADFQPPVDGQGLKDRIQDLGHGTMDMSAKILHGASDMLKNLPIPVETKRFTPSRLLAFGGLLVAGTVAYKRHQQANSAPASLLERAKKRLPSR